MSAATAEVVICGAGIAGISAAYHLAVVHGMRDVALVDERAPLSLTSDKSTECYRNWWPGPGEAMVSLMNRSITMLEELARTSGNAFHLNRRGYVFATADPNRIPDFKRAAEEAAALGAGPTRYHTGQPGDPEYVPAPMRGFEDQPTGADVILDPALIRKCFPYLSEETIAVVHPRRCGWFSAQQLGMYLLERAQERGVKLVQGHVEAVDTHAGRVQAVRVSGGNGSSRISTRCFVNAAGPFIKDVAQLLGVDLPVYSERHVKVAFNDHLGLVPRAAPLLIWTDPVYLPFSEEERAELAQSDEDKHLLEQFPGGIHGRPEGGASSETVLLLWTYATQPVQPTFPLTFDPEYPEIALRGMAVMIPALSAYFNRMPKFFLDGGYYTKTRENRFLAGPLPVEGAYVIGAFSGYGLMAACGAGELLAGHITGSPLPNYAQAFMLERYADPEYQKLLENWGESGQL
ncbi:MAG TPA: FAD-dependent oxidoreductase [Anaerolineae bacterium]|nr:FAD-dependent oxidoreductase [Anaerolineae bacterium]